MSDFTISDRQVNLTNLSSGTGNPINVQGIRNISLITNITGTGTGTSTLQGTMDGANYYDITSYKSKATNSTVTTGTTVSGQAHSSIRGGITFGAGTGVNSTAKVWIIGNG